MRAKSLNRILVRAILTITALLIIGAVMFALWWNGAFLPSYSDYSGEEVLTTRDGIDLEILSLDIQTEHYYRIQKALCFDVDHDNEDELVLLVWKHGSYGKHMPFWERANDIALEQHVFIYDIIDSESLKPIWMSSSIGRGVNKMEEYDSSQLALIRDEGPVTVWEWQHWGLKLVKEIQKDEYR